MTNQELLGKYLKRLENLKENRADTIDTNTDTENQMYNSLIALTAEICRDLRGEELPIEEKVKRVRSLYCINEVCEVLGYGNGHSESTFSEEEYKELEELQVTDFDAFSEKMYNTAAVNGNFQEAIIHNVYLPI